MCFSGTLLEWNWKHFYFPSTVPLKIIQKWKLSFLILIEKNKWIDLYDFFAHSWSIIVLKPI